MKTKLSLIAVAMLVGGWMAVGDSPRVRSMEQRVADLEQLVAEQSFQIAEQKRQIDRIAPIVNEMELVITSDGSRELVIRNASLFLDSGYIQAQQAVIIHSLYYFGSLIDWEP